MNKEKDKSRFSYNLVRVVGTPIFKMKYKPRIIGKENIPDGPVVFAGSHHHAMDQFPVICATNKVIHWCAKAEYFNEEKNSMLGILCRATGAIPVYRGGDTSLVNKLTVDYLNMGSSVGIFPEGTRNGLKTEKIEELYDNLDIADKSHYLSKEEFIRHLKREKVLLSQINFLEELKNSGRISNMTYAYALLETKMHLCAFKDSGLITDKEYDESLLLPFHFGAVSFSSKTGAPVVPFCVKGDFDSSNGDLVVQFGNPIKCDHDKLEENNKELREEILSLEKNYLENKKILVRK